MEIYLVRGGESLSAVARRFGTEAAELARINQLSDPARLVPGMALLVPGESESERRSIEVNACAYPTISDAVMAETLPYLSFFCPLAYRVSTAGELMPAEDARLISAACAQRAAALMTVTNIGRSGGYSGEAAHAIFTVPAVQDAFFDSLLRLLRQKGYYGVNFHLQYIYPYDREAYSAFLRRASEELHRQGYFLLSSIAPRESGAQEGLLCAAQDYAAHGKYADRVVILCHDWGYSYSAPQAVSPLNRVRRVLEYAVGEIPPGKLLLGCSLCGYSWRLPWRQGDAAVPVSSAAAMNLAVASGAEIKLDKGAQSPFFTYTDAAGERRLVRFEDARSHRARLRLVRDYSLAGLSLNTANRLCRPMLELLGSMFDTEKLM